MEQYSRIVTPPSVEPITLTAAKLHLRLAVTEADAVAYTDEDDALNSLITEAREFVESFTRRALITQTWDLALYTFPLGNFIDLPFGQLQSVVSLSYTDSDNNAATFTEYSSDEFRNGIKLNYSESWPAIYPESRITVRFVCGYGNTANDVPENIKRAMFLYIGDQYGNRSESIIPSGRGEIQSAPLGIKRLLANYSLYRF